MNDRRVKPRRVRVKTLRRVVQTLSLRRVVQTLSFLCLFIIVYSSLFFNRKLFYDNTLEKFTESIAEFSDEVKELRATTKNDLSLDIPYDSDRQQLKESSKRITNVHEKTIENFAEYVAGFSDEVKELRAITKNDAEKISLKELASNEFMLGQIENELIKMNGIVKILESEHLNQNSSSDSQKEQTQTVLSSNQDKDIINKPEMIVKKHSNNNSKEDNTKEINVLNSTQTVLSSNRDKDIIKKPNMIVKEHNNNNSKDSTQEIVNVLSSRDVMMENLWRGYDIAAEVDVSKAKKVIVAVSYCAHDINWLDNKILDVLPKESEITLTFLSKCKNGGKIPISLYESRSNVKVEIVPINNVGGCDYAYAYFMKNYVRRVKAEGLDKHDPSSTVLFFVKDTPRKSFTNQHKHYQKRYLDPKKMVANASRGNFACGLKQTCRSSLYSDTSALSNFIIEGYLRNAEREKYLKLGYDPKDMTPNGIDPDFNLHNYKNLGDFHQRGLNWTFPTDITMQCYGGSFAFPASKLFDSDFDDDFFEGLEKALGRGVTIIEEHFMERTWAGLFGKVLTPVEEDIIKDLHMPGAPCPIGEGAICTFFAKSPTCNNRKKTLS